MYPSLKVLKRMRTYNAFVANEKLEDYSLRYAAKSFRRWPEWLLANTALGSISFLALEAIGALIFIKFGFLTTIWTIASLAVIIVITCLPIAYYSSRYNIDIDLLTRGAGFGYIGSTITSLIYASFTFIFLAIEASIMAKALNIAFNMPLYMGYIVCSLGIIPLVFYGITFINKLHLVTQPLWVILSLLPFAFILYKAPETVSMWIHYIGDSTTGTGFNSLIFGTALTMSFSLIVQIGEQVDYLRFLPEKNNTNKTRWWLTVVFAGPGWILIGGAKMLAGSFLACLAVGYHHFSRVDAIDPVILYLNGFHYVVQNPKIVVALTAVFVIISQIKINVTNAYAGSLAWSNFFSRIMRSHPGRVIWLIFNVMLALVLMQFGLVFTLESVLGVYSNFATAWIGALTADLILLKPLGISPPYIEFKRAHLYSINPVGFGAMTIASIVSIIFHFGFFGPYPQAFSALIALCLSFFLAPVIAVITKGKYYIAREKCNFETDQLIKCSICHKEYEPEDMTFCPVYNDNVCSLCCSLDIVCKGRCKANESDREDQIAANTDHLSGFSTHFFWFYDRQFKIFLVHFLSVAVITGAIFVIFYFSETDTLYTTHPSRMIFFSKLYFCVLLVFGIWCWWFSLIQENQNVTEDELDKHILELNQEVIERKKAEDDLKKSEESLRLLNENLEGVVRERTKELKRSYASLRQADKMATLGILISGVAHEINNPVGFIKLNSKILFDAWNDILPTLQTYNDEYEELYLAGMPFEYARQSLPKLLKGIHEGSERITGIVDNLKDYSRQTPLNMAGKVDINQALDASLILLNNSINKSTKALQVMKSENIAGFRGDTRSVEQVLINLIQNACQALPDNDKSIVIKTYADNGYVVFSIRDEGVGIPPENFKHIRDPFFTTKRHQGGTGLGLSISERIIEDHRGIMEIDSEVGKGTAITLKFPVEAD